MDTEGASPYLRDLLAAAEEEARRRGEGWLTPEHLVLALTRPPSWPADLLGGFDLDPLDWRDGVNTVLGWQEGAAAEREGRPAGRLAESPADKRFEGIMAVASSVDAIVALSTEEAARNGEEAGPAHVLVALLLEGNSVASASGRWFGLTPSRLRAAAGLRNERRVVADGIPPSRSPRPAGCGPVILCGGGTDDDLLARIVAVVRTSSASRKARVALVEASWHIEPPTPEVRRVEAERWRRAGADVLDVVLVERADAASPAVSEAMAGADLVWFAAGDGSALYDRLWGTPALAAVRHAHDRGAAVGGVSAGAVVWGVGHLSDYASLGEEEPYPLFGWLHDVVVFPHWFASREARFRQTVRAFPGCRGLAVAHGGAVAVGADGQIDVIAPRHGWRHSRDHPRCRDPPRSGADINHATTVNAAPDAVLRAAGQLSVVIRRGGYVVPTPAHCGESRPGGGRGDRGANMGHLAEHPCRRPVALRSRRRGCDSIALARR